MRGAHGSFRSIKAADAIGEGSRSISAPEIFLDISRTCRWTPIHRRFAHSQHQNAFAAFAIASLQRSRALSPLLRHLHPHFAAFEATSTSNSGAQRWRCRSTSTKTTCWLRSSAEICPQDTSRSAATASRSGASPSTLSRWAAPPRLPPGHVLHDDKIVQSRLCCTALLIPNVAGMC